MEYIVIIACIVVVLGIIFLRKKDGPTDYVEPTFKASGKKWVFNGSLDIDNPPTDMKYFDGGETELQLMVKRGFVHYSLTVDKDLDFPLGMFRGKAFAEEGGIRIVANGKTVGHLEGLLTELMQSVANKQDGAEAYGFIARKNDMLWGEVCVKK